jgi:phenylacetate-coenzyme A ligase PaaK-like adenylate-forming protein
MLTALSDGAMRIDFSDVPLKDRAFNESPMSFADPMAKSFLAAIVDIAAIETGNRTAREYWQQKQLQNLLEHAAQRSAFWKKRIGARKIKSIRLSDLPIQTRADVVAQFESEGSLMQSSDQNKVRGHSTSGSTGKPVQFFVTTQSSKFNAARSAAQFFMAGRDLSLNWTRLVSRKNSGEFGFEVRKTDCWIEPLQNLVRTGVNKHIAYFQPNMEALCRELERDRIGYLVVQPRFIDILLQHVGPEFFKRTDTAMVIPLAEAMDPELRKMLSSANIPVHGSYSSEEVGLIASECETIPSTFHIATSNVVVEIDADPSVKFENRQMGRVLVTHLHSYATPFIRYDLGDAAMLEQRCPCGHDGPVLSNINGRAKSLLKHADGRVSIFLLRGKELMAVARFTEYRVRQVDLRTIVADIGGRDSLALEETEALIALVRSHAGGDFEIRINPVVEIDWGYSTKRLGFVNEVLIG